MMKMRGEGGGAQEYGALAAEARNYVWMGAIPLHVELHKDEIVILPAPPPFMLLAPRNGYLPLLVDTIRPHFQAALPPGSDTVWFDYNGLPLKWYIPTGVLFDLLCVEPQRPWRLTVHFRTFPSDILTPCDGEEAVKWNFINTLKESSYIMYGNTKTVMNLSQTDQSDLWRAVVNGDGETYERISVRLRPNASYAASVRGVARVGSDAHSAKPGWASLASPARVPLRFYIRVLQEEVDDLYEVPSMVSWDDVAYASKPIDVPKDEGKVLTIRDALMKAVPDLFSSCSPPPSPGDGEETATTVSNSESASSEGDRPVPDPAEDSAAAAPTDSPAAEGDKDGQVIGVLHCSGQDVDNVLQGSGSRSKLNGFVRVQGIEPDLDLPLDWVARNMSCPEHFIHVIVFTWPQQQ